MSNRLKRLGILTISISLCIAATLGFASVAPLKSKNLSKEPSEEEILSDTSQPLFFMGKAKVNPTPEILPPGAEVTVLDGNPNQPGPFTIRLKIPKDYEIPAHWGFSDEHITIISGALNLGIGDQIDKGRKGQSKRLTAGHYARIPAKMHHFAWSTEETVLQLHGMGPWGLSYVNPEDQSLNSNTEEIIIDDEDSSDIKSDIKSKKK